MSEAGLMGAEGDKHDGIHIWSDLFYVEVVDPESGRQLPEGEVGTFEVSPEIEVLEQGALAKLFESSIKAPRFVDERR